MRSFIVLLSVLAAAAPAHANQRAAKLDASTLPTACRWMLPVPAGAPARIELAAITSAATCSARVRLNAVRVEPTQASAAELQAAAAPSVAMLDSVIASNDVEAKLIAEYEKANILDGLATRLAASIGPATNLVGADAVAFKRRADDAYALGEPFRQQAFVAFREVNRLAPSAGKATKNPVVAYAISASRAAGAPVVSRR